MSFFGITVSGTPRLAYDGGTASQSGYDGGTASSTGTDGLSGGSASSSSLPVVSGGVSTFPFAEGLSGGSASSTGSDVIDGGAAYLYGFSDTGETTISTLTLVPEVADALAAQGIDPASVNSVVWPAYGASRWATARLLMSRAAVDGVGGLKSLLDNGGVENGPEVFLKVHFGSRTFPQMVPGKIIPVLVNAKTAIYVVELHCRRWLWRHVKAIPSATFEAVDASRGYNTVGLSRGRFRRHTLTGDAKWDFADIVERVLAGDPDNGYPALMLSTDTLLTSLGGSLLTTKTLLADTSADDTAPGLIDRVLARCGQVLYFAPNASEDAYDIRIEDITTGEARAASFLDSMNTELLAGGCEGFVEAEVSGDVASNAVGSVDGATRDCPRKVRVHFPYALTDQTDEALAEGRTGSFPYSSSSHQSIADGKSMSVPSWDSDVGRPFTDESRMPERYHVRCEVPINTFDRQGTSTSDLVEDTDDDGATVAASVAQIYYGRFWAGACDLWLRDAVQLTSDVTWAGAQWWVWQLRQDGDGYAWPVTHIHGERDCELFGYTPSEGPEEVLGFGTVSAWRGSDNAIRVVGHVVGPIPVMLRIKSYSAIPAKDYQWSYSCVILQRDDSAVDGWSEGQTVTAYNTVERKNTTSYAGPGYALPLSAAPAMEPLPIGVDRNGAFTETDVPGHLVEDRSYTGGRKAYFALSNAIDGDCPP